MDFIIEPAYAKINLYLDIVKKRSDGYHDILSVMQNISLCDKIKITKSSFSKIDILSSSKNLPQDPKDNLIYRAAKLFFDELCFNDCGVTIEIEKNIPVSAGMAGGSSDAAATLRGMNKMFGHPFSIDKLCEIGKRIGADVPFCIVGGAKITEGIGDKLINVGGLPDCYIVTACGKESVSTPEAYKALDNKFNDFSNYDHGIGFEQLVSAINSNDLESALGYMFNVFEEVIKENTSIPKIKNILSRHNAKISMMSGSGPSVFGVFYNESDADSAAKDLISNNISATVCVPINSIDI